MAHDDDGPDIRNKSSKQALSPYRICQILSYWQCCYKRTAHVQKHLMEIRMLVVYNCQDTNDLNFTKIVSHSVV